MDLDISLRSSDCPFTVHFYGAMFREGDVMIVMEVMDISLDKFYMRAKSTSKSIPEEILGKIAFSVIYLFHITCKFAYSNLICIGMYVENITTLVVGDKCT